MHKYIIDSGWLVMPSGNAIEAQGREVCLHAEAYAALATKDRDLADANHALLLANNSADAFKRVAEVAQNNLRALMQQARWLRRVTEEIDERRIAPGWANTCRMAADEIERMQPTNGASNG